MGHVSSSDICACDINSDPSFQLACSQDSLFCNSALTPSKFVVGVGGDVEPHMLCEPRCSKPTQLPTTGCSSLCFLLRGSKYK